jgi:hypothetical protein
MPSHPCAVLLYGLHALDIHIEGLRALLLQCVPQLLLVSNGIQAHRPTVTPRHVLCTDMCLVCACMCVGQCCQPYNRVNVALDPAIVCLCLLLPFLLAAASRKLHSTPGMLNSQAVMLRVLGSFCAHWQNIIELTSPHI